MAKSTSSIDASIEFLRDFVFVEKAPTEQEQKLSQEELDALHSVILGAIVVSFDHEIGATIETFYPDSLEKYQDTSWWTKLPNFALADGIHTADLDMVLFQIQDDDSDLVVYCCAYFRQVHAKSISPSQSSGTNSPRTPSTSTPRSRMQKSVVLVSRKPCYSFMVDTLELYAAKYFSVKNYCDERVMSRMLRHVAHEKVHVDATDQTVCAMDLRWFVAKYGRQFLRIFKGLLINCTTCVYALPVKDACSAAILLASFIPMLCPDLTPEQCKQFSQSIPYLPVTEIDGFLKTCDPSKVCSFGSSSMLYVVHPHKLMDVSADVVNGVVKYSEKCEKALKLSYADAVCIDYILQEIQDSHRGPDWIRRRLYEYIQSFLGFHAKTEAESSNGFRLALLDLNHDYNKEWSERFSKTALFEYIYSVYNQNHGKGKIVPVQPTESQSSQVLYQGRRDWRRGRGTQILRTNSIDDELQPPTSHSHTTGGSVNRDHASPVGGETPADGRMPANRHNVMEGAQSAAAVGDVGSRPAQHRRNQSERAVRSHAQPQVQRVSEETEQERLQRLRALAMMQMQQTAYRRRSFGGRWGRHR